MSILGGIARRVLPSSDNEQQASSSPLIAGTLLWTCNICGAANHSMAQQMHREGGACAHCGSIMRFRALAAVLTTRLFGEIRILRDLTQDSSIRGLGMSDSDCYCKLLAQKFNYTNTYYHCDPLLDITQPAEQWLGDHDFVISSDVFEHVPPPVQRAFDNLLSLLKPGGLAIFSVPFSLDSDTCEHFPNLHEFTVSQDDNNEWVLRNVTQQGKSEEFRDLIFHGGPGSTLELRLFSQRALEEHFSKAGFVDLCIHDEAYFEYGIFWLHPWSLVMSAVKPR